MALILARGDGTGEAEIFGVARIAADPDNEAAEYAIIVREELSGLGLGRRLMDRLISYARSRSLKRLFGSVLNENARMLNLCRDLGFTMEHDPMSPGTTLTRLEL